jgi:peptidyl-prolyl cis-trans isomerase A (cyclophilin A)
MLKNVLIVLFVFFLSFSAFTSNQKNVKVIIETEIGVIHLEIYSNKAPVTAKNFLKYVELNLYTNTNFFRTVKLDNQPTDKIKIEVIQAGGVKNDKTLSPISHETTEKTGILHRDGTISMARGKPGTAQSSFFICINDQPELDFGGRRNPDGQGFAAFGKVVKGMKIVRLIQNRPGKGQQLTPPVKIKRIYMDILR